MSRTPSSAAAACCIVRERSRSLSSSLFVLARAQHQWNWYTHTQRQTGTHACNEYASIPVWETIRCSCCCCCRARLEPAAADDNEAQHVRQNNNGVAEISIIRKGKPWKERQTRMRRKNTQNKNNNICRIKETLRKQRLSLGSAKTKATTTIAITCTHWSRVCTYVTHLNKPGNRLKRHTYKLTAVHIHIHTHALKIIYQNQTRLFFSFPFMYNSHVNVNFLKLRSSFFVYFGNSRLAPVT